MFLNKMQLLKNSHFSRFIEELMVDITVTSLLLIGIFTKPHYLAPFIIFFTLEDIVFEWRMYQEKMARIPTPAIPPTFPAETPQELFEPLPVYVY